MIWFLQYDKSSTYWAFAARPKSRRSKTDESVAEDMPPPCVSSMDFRVNAFSSSRWSKQHEKKKQKWKTEVYTWDEKKKRRRRKRKVQRPRNNPEMRFRRGWASWSSLIGAPNLRGRAVDDWNDFVKSAESLSLLIDELHDDMEVVAVIGGSGGGWGW